VPSSLGIGRVANPPPLTNLPYLPVALGACAAAVALAPSLTWKALLAAPILLAPPALWTIFSERRWISLFFVFALLLPPLPFALGDTGPHPALAIVALGVCAGIVRLREWRVRLEGPALPMLALFAALLISIGPAMIYSGTSIAVASLARVLLFGISVYVLLYTATGPARYDDRDIRRTTRLLFAVACGSALFACIDFYFQFPAPAGYGPQFVWLDSGIFRRAQGFFYEASTLGNFCAFFLVMICVALFRRGGWLPCSRKALAAGGVLFSAALVFSYSRASVLNLLAALIAFSYLQGLRIRRVLLFAGATAAAGVIVAYAAFPQFTESYWLRLRFTAETLFNSPEWALSGRLQSWRTLLDFLSTHPWHWIFGVGYKTLPYSDYIGRPVVADNMYLGLLVETGMVGLLAFLIFNISILYSARRAAYSADARKAFFGRWMFCFWVGQMFQMFSGDLLTYWRVLPVYFWVLAIAVRNEDSISRSI